MDEKTRNLPSVVTECPSGKIDHSNDFCLRSVEDLVLSLGVLRSISPVLSVSLQFPPFYVHGHTCPETGASKLGVSVE